MYTYRMAQPSDLPWMDQAAAVSAWESLSEEDRALIPPERSTEMAQGELRTILGGSGGLGIVAQHGHRPIGFLLGAVGPDTTTQEMHGHVVSIWVSPEHRRRGVADAMQQHAERMFEQMGLRKVKVWTGLHNQAAVSLAKKRGYQPEGLIGFKSL